MGRAGLALIMCMFCSVSSCTTRPRPGTGQLVVVGSDVQPCFVEDSAAIVYQHYASFAADTQVTGLYLLRLDTSTTRLVAPGLYEGFDWLRGTDSIAVATGNGVSLLSLADRGTNRLLTHDAFNVRASPDGRFLAFDGGVGNRSHLLIFDRTTSTLADPTPDSMIYEYPAWSPTGHELAIVGGSPALGGLLIITPQGAPVRLLAPATSYPRSPAWSSGGGTIAWEQHTNGIVAVIVTDTLGALSTNLGRGYEGIAWMAGDSALAYSSVTASGPRIFLLNRSTHALRQLTH